MPRQRPFSLLDPDAPGSWAIGERPDQALIRLEGLHSGRGALNTLGPYMLNRRTDSIIPPGCTKSAGDLYKAAGKSGKGGKGKPQLRGGGGTGGGTFGDHLNLAKPMPKKDTLKQHVRDLVKALGLGEHPTALARPRQLALPAPQQPQLFLPNPAKPGAKVFVPAGQNQTNTLGAGDKFSPPVGPKPARPAPKTTSGMDPANWPDAAIPRPRSTPYVPPAPAAGTATPTSPLMQMFNMRPGGSAWPSRQPRPEPNPSHLARALGLLGLGGAGTGTVLGYNWLTDPGDPAPPTPPTDGRRLPGDPTPADTKSQAGTEQKINNAIQSVTQPVGSHLQKWWPAYGAGAGVAAGGLGIYALMRHLRKREQAKQREGMPVKEAADAAYFVEQYPLAAGFLLACGERNMSEVQIRHEMAKAASLNPAIAAEFEKVAETVGAKPVPAPIPPAPAAPKETPGAGLGTAGPKPVTPAVPGAPGPVPQPAASPAATPAAANRAKMQMSPAAQSQVAPPTLPSEGPDYHWNSQIGRFAADFGTGQPIATSRDGLQWQRNRDPLTADTKTWKPYTQGEADAAAQRAAPPAAPMGPPKPVTPAAPPPEAVANAGFGKKNVITPGQPAPASQTPNPVLDATAKAQAQAKADPKGAKDAFGRITNQVVSFFTSDEPAAAEVKTAAGKAMTTGQVPPEMAATGQEALKGANPNTPPEGIMAIWDNMGTAEKVILGLGLGVGALGLVSAMSGEGGAGSWLMTILGLGAGGMAAASGGLMGKDMQQGARGLMGTVMGAVAPDLKKQLVQPEIDAGRDEYNRRVDAELAKLSPLQRVGAHMGRSIGLGRGAERAQVIAEIQRKSGGFLSPPEVEAAADQIMGIQPAAPPKSKEETERDLFGDG